MSTEQLSMSMFASRADYDAAMRAQDEQLEQLPDGLQLAIDGIRAWAMRMGTAASGNEAIAAIRAEHAKRVTLQHHAVDLAQQIEDLLFAAESGGRRIAGLEAERDHTAAHVASIARQLGDESLHVDDIAVRVLGLVSERNELRDQVHIITSEREDLADGMQALRPKLAAAEAAGRRIAELEAERDELRARLAEIEAQEPVAFARYSVHSRKPASVDLVSEYEEWQHDTGLLGDHWGGNEPLYARPVPAQAVPDGQRNGITLNASQLRHALDFAAPDFDKDEDQRKVEVSIGWREMGEVLDDDGHPYPAGYVAWLAEYPEEGCTPLLESWDGAPATAQAVPDGWRMVPVEPTQKQWNAGCKAAREYLDEAGGNSPAVIYRAMVDEAPEHKA